MLLLPLTRSQGRALQPRSLLAPPPPLGSGHPAAAAAARGLGAAVRGVVALFLPRNTDLRQLASLVPAAAAGAAGAGRDGGAATPRYRCVWHVERAYVNKRLKGITAYCFPPPPLPLPL
jgi:hypothetical protein